MSLLKTVSRRAMAMAIVIGVCGSMPQWARAASDKAAAKEYLRAANVDFQLGRFTEALAGYNKAYETPPAQQL
jgi:hypothetical protein